MAKSISLKESVSVIQWKETEAEKQRLIEEGFNYIELEKLKEKLFELGLKLDLSEKGYLNCYYNTMNEFHYYLEATTHPLEKSGLSCYNVRSEWYNKEEHTEKGSKLMKLRCNYFSSIKRKGKEYILFF